MNVSQGTIDLMVGVAIRKLGITCPPDVLIDLSLQTADIVKRAYSENLTENYIVSVFEGCIDAYLNGRRSRNA